MMYFEQNDRVLGPPRRPLFLASIRCNSRGHEIGKLLTAFDLLIFVN